MKETEINKLNPITRWMAVYKAFKGTGDFVAQFENNERTSIIGLTSYNNIWTVIRKSDRATLPLGENGKLFLIED
jgi:hypothetical protein